MREFARDGRRLSMFRRWLWPLLLAFGAVSCANVRIPESGSRQRVVFYAVATDLSPGAALSWKDLEPRLQRLGYREVTPPLSPGQYHPIPGGVELFLRPFHYPGRDFSGGRLRLHFFGGTINRVQPIDPLNASDLRLEPERIAGFEGETGAVLRPLRLEEAPPLLVKALIEVEAHRFYHHPGISP